MEAWFVADRENLARHFGKPPTTIDDYPDVESVPKPVIEKIMAKTSRGPNYRTYDKMNDGPRLLSKLNATIVQRKARHCRRLFETLDRLLEDV